MRSTCSGVLFCSILSATAHSQTTERLSVDSFGRQVVGPSGHATICANGRYVAFTGYGPGLVPDDVNGFPDVFVRDRLTALTTLVSVSSTGVQGNGASWHASISGDGRFVAFQSLASVLVPGDTNNVSDVFVHDRLSGTTTCASFGPLAPQLDKLSAMAEISVDGRYVAFFSDATNLVPGDTNGVGDIFVRDLQTGTIVRASVDSTGVEANFTCIRESISGDGRYVAFASYASNLVPGDTNGAEDVFVRDLVAGTTVRASVDSSGAQGNGDSGLEIELSSLHVSVDGRFVVFSSRATNLVPVDANGKADLFVHDMTTGTTELVSLDSAGSQLDGDSGNAMLSADGRRVVFESAATNAVANDTNGASDVFVRDLQLGRTTRVSVSASGLQAGGTSFEPEISADGRDVVFTSHAPNLVAGDSNAASDVFLHDRFGSPPIDPFVPFCFGDGSLATQCPCAPPDFVPSPSGNPGFGCANSFRLSGALLTATGSGATDSIRLYGDIGFDYTGFAFLVKGDAHSTVGFASGDGVTCVDGNLIRFGAHRAATNGDFLGLWSYPNSVQTTSVSVITAQSAGQDAWYQLVYRNAAAGFCSPGTINWTNGIRYSWP